MIERRTAMRAQTDNEYIEGSLHCSKLTELSHLKIAGHTVVHKAACRKLQNVSPLSAGNQILYKEPLLSSAQTWSIRKRADTPQPADDPCKGSSAVCQGRWRDNLVH